MANFFIDKSKLEIVKIYCELFALFVAGIWVYFNYINKEAPSLFRSNNAEVTLTIDSLNSDHINAELVSHIKNSGKQAFSIDSIFIDYWLVPIEEYKNKEYFSCNDYMEIVPPISVIKDRSLLGNYGIEDEYSQSYVFTFKKDYNKMLLMRMRYYLEVDKWLWFNEKVEGYYYTFKYHCVPDK